MEKIQTRNVEVRQPERMSIVRDNRRLKIYEGSVSIDHFLENGKIYELNYDTGGCVLDICEDFTFPEKLYDVEIDFRSQVITTLKSQPRNVGVLLEGYKGQGKTVNAKLLCQEANLPIIMITQRIPQQVDFVQFINNLKTDLVIFIDEFEKLFPQTYQSEAQDGFHSQQSFLTFMDGAFGSKYKRLFILTTNDPVNDKMINRPSRIRYYRRYSQMDPKVYNMVINDKLINKEFEEDLKKNLTEFDCTVDLLTTVIDEINIHNKPYSAFKSIFNHKPNIFKYEQYKQDATGRWQLTETFETSRKIEREDRTINGAYNCVIFDMKDDYIYYRATEWETIHEGTDKEDEVKKETVYRLREINSLPQHYVR
jgi:hypothetical protein